MNSFIELLNLWGGHALRFAWLMLWQSSLLMVVVFALDHTLRRRVRAAVRYALWLVVLVKLLLPPSLALPTGLAWWLRSSEPTQRPAATQSFIVTYPETAAQRLPPLLETKISPPAPGLSGAAWALMGSALGSAALLSWLLVRWRQVARHVRQALPASGQLCQSFTETIRLTRLPQNTRLRVTPQTMSPAICGLFHPTVLLPESLVEKLPANQIRAVLLHELIHLRRGDIWVNFAQALLQIVYWWHPLLWPANARVRRVREEAVDDAVMLALAGEADAYAPTLLEVARLAFNRPLASLGLVGILESRNALRQRIERLVNFNTPRRAGLSVVSLLGITAFTALALPMGEAPNHPVNLIVLPKEPAGPELRIRGFHLNSNMVSQVLQKADALDVSYTTATNPNGTRMAYAVAPADLAQRVAHAAVGFFKSIGVDLDPKLGKNVYFNETKTTLLVRATPQDLDIIEAALGTFNPGPEINISVKFVEVPELDPAGELFKLLQANVVSTNREIETSATSSPTQPSAVVVITDAQYRAALRAVQKMQGAVLINDLAVQKMQGAVLINDFQVTTLSGRPAQIQAVNLTLISTNVSPRALQPPGVASADGTNALYETMTVPLGPMVDLVPFIEQDGYTIRLNAIPSIIEFLGYDEPTNSVTAYIDGKEQTVFVPRPHFLVRQMAGEAAVRDGQTVMLASPPGAQGNSAAASVLEKKRLLVFVTPTLVDSAGNRVHPDAGSSR